MMQQGGTLSGQQLIFLFDMELEHRHATRTTAPGKSDLGDYLASGEGAAFGPRLSGIVRWDLFIEEHELARKATLRGFIKTDDGAKIHFEALCFFIRAQPTQPTKWATTAAVHFQSDDRAYEWINTSPTLWHGQFDMGNSRHSYRVFAQGNG